MASAQRPTLGSLRVSTATQDLEKDTAALLSLANDRHLGKAPCMEETGSGRGSWRQRQLAEVLDHAYKGDTSLSSDLSRLGRSMLECMEILSIAVARGSTISAVKGGWTLERSRQSKILAMAFAMAAASARQLISPRTTEALRVKQAGYLPQAIEALLAHGSTQKCIAHRYQTTAANLHHGLKQRGIQKSRIVDPRAGTKHGRGRVLGECTDLCWNKPTSAYDTVQCAGSPRGNKSA